MFDYALHAAIKRTKYEYDLTARGLTKADIKVFTENPQGLSLEVV